jgi:CheY-like chemotaxis protein
MTKDQLNRLFTAYARFNMETNQGIPGTGLGLNITKRIVHLMEGEINVESEPGKGSVFTVRLPQKDCGSGPCGTEVAESLRNFSFSNTSISKKTQIVYEHMPYGKVLVVDDVESNLYVAKGLLTPYELNIETAQSGNEAIKKVKNGAVYDIIFMDHMMPVMDGIAAANILRASGYSHPIVALTANAISGQAEIFLSNGFDRFLSKPIDSRELDIVLKELIRDKQPPEIPEAARRTLQRTQQREKAVIRPKNNLIEMRKYFIKDAENTINVLDNINAKADDLNNTDIKSHSTIVEYTTAVHAIKSALKNIGETKLSEFAFDLEKAGRERNFNFIVDKTPVFMEELKSLVQKLKPEETNSAAPVSHNEILYLKEKLNELKTACEAFNTRAAEAVLSELKQKTWPQETDDAINEISECLLCSEFEKAVSIAEGIINTAQQGGS